MENIVRVSVTSLADFSCREGDLMPIGVVGPSAREGMKAHTRLQKSTIEAARSALPPELENATFMTDVSGNQAAPLMVESEVRISCECLIEAVQVELSGRMDMVDYRGPVISEIKTTLVPATEVPSAQRALQWAQLYLYGFMFLHTRSSEGSVAEAVTLQLIHINLRADKTTPEQRVVGRSELERFARAALTRYVVWLKHIQAGNHRLALTASSLDFPHTSFRRGQRDMAAAVFRAIRDKLHLMCEAPTGIGKTISTLFPASKALGEQKIKQVVYLTAKVGGRLSALQALKQLESAGLSVSAVQIRAKQQTCFCSNGRCERDDAGRCPMTLGFYDRLHAARHELLALGIIEDEQLDDIAWQHQLCPFELALQMLPWVHVVIADYNYVFDPLVRLPHFAESRKDTALLVDEAHNLVDRSRSMFSAELSREQCLAEASICRLTHPLVAKSLDRLCRTLLELVRDQGDDESIAEAASSSVARAVAEAVENMLGAFAGELPLSDSGSELFRVLCRYLAIHELFSDDHRCIIKVARNGKRKQIEIALYCLDASTFLARQYGIFRSSIVFSATLRPSLFYRDTLGLPDQTYHLRLDSPFPVENAYHAVVNWIDTRYRQRESSLSSLIALIKNVSDQRAGNYLVFFPSYVYLNQAFDAFCRQFPDVEIWKQTHEQGREEQCCLLEHMSQKGHRIGFAILGGVFGEGIDYRGDRLIGVIVVSTGLPGLDTKAQLLAEYYRSRGNDGFDFAYRYPGFTRVLQTVGRLIRSDSDCGVVVLVDSRFGHDFYTQLYPDTWQVSYPTNPGALYDGISDFWRGVPLALEHTLDG